MSAEVPFSRFMEDALYGPSGYYETRVRVGSQGGDFTTAARLPLFGATLARYAERTWEEFGRPEVLQVVEFGAGQGELASQVCAGLSERLPELRVEYVIIERSARLRQVQRERLAGRRTQVAGRCHVRWGSPRAGPVTLVLANEVLDAQPVELVRRERTGWLRGFVQTSSGRPRLVWRPAPDWLVALARRWLPVPVGSTAELCLHYLRLFRRAAATAVRGRALWFDYGITTAEWASGVRPWGTVRGYRNHQVLSLQDILVAAGECDMTADVHWDFAAACARQAGWRVVRIVDQGPFLLSAGIAEQCQQLWRAETDALHASRWTAQLKRLVLPGEMGERFAVLECERAKV
ncbi:MAG: SAM-dependent methyltransferase [Alicyclobacillaceae bacterium]|nr:SAM-dependent methyltransferase [Alicyclobacillaceae bacterium]